MVWEVGGVRGRERRGRGWLVWRFVDAGVGVVVWKGVLSEVELGSG